MSQDKPLLFIVVSGCFAGKYSFRRRNLQECLHIIHFFLFQIRGA